ncbi:MAG TPA: CopG family transcriptional regulator, partial [Chloroflexia bacterium]|nr:CopG family transcriptional regulator [Chloroflexia bacterium]
VVAAAEAGAAGVVEASASAGAAEGSPVVASVAVPAAEASVEVARPAAVGAAVGRQAGVGKAMKVRKQIYITAEQDAELKRLSYATGESESEIIRRALTSFLRRTTAMPGRTRAWQEETKFMQSLLSEDYGPEPDGRTWTREELYSREN